MSIQINRFVLAFLILCSSACSGWESVSCRQLTRQETIHYFIEDISRKPGPLRGSDLVYLSVYDTVYKYLLVQDHPNPNYPNRLDGGFRWSQIGQYDGVNAIAFISLLDDTASMIDSPNRYMKAHGHYFFWRDGDASNSEVEDFLLKRGLFRVSNNMKGSLSQPIINDNTKMVVYYFRKGNPCRYKRVIDSRAVGYYPPPL